MSENISLVIPRDYIVIIIVLEQISTNEQTSSKKNLAVHHQPSFRIQNKEMALVLNNLTSGIVVDILN